MRVRYKFLVAAMSLAVSAVWTGVARAEAPPVARALFEQSLDYAYALNTLSFDLLIQSDVTVKGSPTRNELSLSVLLDGSNRARVRSTAGEDEALIYSDGTERYIHLVNLNKYVKGSAPTDRRAIMMMAGGGPIRMVSAWVGEYLIKHGELLSKLEAADYVAKEKSTPESAGEAHHLRLSYANYDAHVYIAAAGEPALERLMIDFTKSLGANKTAIEKMEINAYVTNWNTTPEITAEAFGWRPGPEVELYTPPAPQAAAGGGGAQLGAPAPEFTLGKFGGGEVALAQHKDKDIVVLDFFASWCGPCRMSMPVVHETLKAYADKGVQLYGVNLREPDEKVTQFLTASKIEGMPVLLDRNGAVAMQYGASSIPRLIIVGKDGTVQAIHSGYSPALVEELKTQLDQLLGGKPLVTPASS